MPVPKLFHTKTQKMLINWNVDISIWKSKGKSGCMYLFMPVTCGPKRV